MMTEQRELSEAKQRISVRRSDARLSYILGNTAALATTGAGTYTATEIPHAFSNHTDPSVSDARVATYAGVTFTLTLAAIALWFYKEARADAKEARNLEASLHNGNQCRE